MHFGKVSGIWLPTEAALSHLSECTSANLMRPFKSSLGTTTGYQFTIKFHAVKKELIDISQIEQHFLRI